MAENAPALTRILDVVEAPISAGTIFESKKVASLYDWWAAANGGRIPGRKLFDVIEHKPIVASLFLVERRANQDFIYRLLGEDVIQIVGRNRTGEIVKRVNTGEYGHEMYDYYRRVAESRNCWKCTGSLLFAIGGARRFESIDCPLGGGDGEQVSAIVGVMDLVK